MAVKGVKVTFPNKDAAERAARKARRHATTGRDPLWYGTEEIVRRGKSVIVRLWVDDDDDPRSVVARRLQLYAGTTGDVWYL